MSKYECESEWGSLIEIGKVIKPDAFLADFAALVSF